MRVGIVLKGNAGWIGGLEYIKNVVAAAEKAATDIGKRVDFAILSTGKIPDELAQQVATPVEWVPIAQNVQPQRFGRLRRFFENSSNDRPIDQAVRQAKVDFVYPIDSLSPAVPCRRAAWIPDLQHRAYPEFSSREELIGREKWIGAMLRDAPSVVLSSEAARADFVRHYPAAKNELHVLPFRIRISKGVLDADSRAVVRAYNLPERFMVVSNQFWKHKNHGVVFEAIRIVRAHHPGLVVAMTGALNDYRHPEYSDLCLSTVHKLGINDNVRILGLIPKADQLQLLRASAAVVQPSLFEGWSTIVEEAHCLGKILLLSDIPVHREQMPPLARYFVPQDPEALARLMIDVCETTDAESNSERIEPECLCRYGELFRDFGCRFLELAARSGSMTGGAWRND